MHHVCVLHGLLSITVQFIVCVHVHRPASGRTAWGVKADLSTTGGTEPSVDGSVKKLGHKSVLSGISNVLRASASKSMVSKFPQHVVLEMYEDCVPHNQHGTR
jgi:hypothetical protein